jgi:hypothetical protein
MTNEQYYDLAIDKLDRYFGKGNYSVNEALDLARFLSNVY